MVTGVGSAGFQLSTTKFVTPCARHYRDALPWGRTNTGQHAAFQCLWLQFDHVLPHSRGGPTDLDNLIITCGPLQLREIGLDP